MIKVVLRTLLSYVLFMLVLIVIGIPCLVLMMLPARWRYDNKVYFWFADLFYRSVLWLTFIPVIVEGVENIPTTPSIIVANHQSSLDIPLIGSVLHRFPHVWLATTELAGTWLAPAVKRMAVLIDMTTPQRGMRSLRQAISAIQEQQRHAIIFPEGGRHASDNGVREFFSGFAMLAQRTNRPVVPIMIFDANKVRPAGSFLMYWHPMTVIVGPRFTLQEDESLDAFKDRVRQWFVEQVA
jgi:1-acyl-sn-glycerol-3-phosphate acyltransferase